MPSTQYLKLTDVQRKKIFESSLIEFSENGYELASTNRIVQKINISKGSLFKYFGSKKGLFIYVCQQCANRLVHYLITKLDKLPEDFFESLKYLAMLEMFFYQQHPKIFHLFLRIKNESNHPVHTTVLEYYQSRYEQIHKKILGQLNIQDFRLESSGSNVLEIVEWVLEGFQNKTILSVEDISDLEEWKEYISRELDFYFSILKFGVYPLTKGR